MENFLEEDEKDIHLFEEENKIFSYELFRLSNKYESLPGKTLTKNCFCTLF